MTFLRLAILAPWTPKGQIGFLIQRARRLRMRGENLRPHVVAARLVNRHRLGMSSEGIRT